MEKSILIVTYLLVTFYVLRKYLYFFVSSGLFGGFGTEFKWTSLEITSSLFLLVHLDDSVMPSKYLQLIQLFYNPFFPY